ncbi:MAG: hypothetical protein ACFBQW_06225 [Sphingomonadaceae bacterium]
MELPSFLRFHPVPLRAQHNGWLPTLQRRFVLALARGAGPSAAARSVGKSRQSAYRLRARPGGESFAAAWDAAQAFARRVAAVSAPASNFGGIDTILVPRTYRGRLVGFVSSARMWQARCASWPDSIASPSESATIPICAPGASCSRPEK